MAKNKRIPKGPPPPKAPRPKVEKPKPSIEYMNAVINAHQPVVLPLQDLCEPIDGHYSDIESRYVEVALALTGSIASGSLNRGVDVDWTAVCRQAFNGASIFLAELKYRRNLNDRKYHNEEEGGELKDE